MHLKQLTPKIWISTPEEDSDRPVLGYILGSKFSLVVDAGNSQKHVREFYQLLREQGLPMPKYTAITHWHWDHTFGMHETKGHTIAGKKTNDILDKIINWEWTEEEMQRRILTGEATVLSDRCIRKEYADRNEIKIKLADIVFEGNITIDLGDVKCEIFETHAIHSEDTVMIYVPEEEVIFIGDADADHPSRTDIQTNRENIKSMINLFKQLNVRTVVIGHDKPQNIKEEMEYLYERLEQLSE